MTHAIMKRMWGAPWAICGSLGSGALGVTARVGHVVWFLGGILRRLLGGPWYFRPWLAQMAYIGFYSLPVVGLTAIFTGAVLALQSYTGFSRFEAQSAIATVVVLSITRELGPVLTGLMVAGRVGASIAAELGTMRVTEQIDALSTLHTDPTAYLLVPRMVAAIVMLPLLVCVADSIGVLGGYLVAVHRLGFNPELYLQHTLEYLKWSDVASGLVKAAVFGGVIALMGGYYGYHSQGGAQGVGRATTHAVVASSILILLLNYWLTSMTFAS